MREKIKIRFNHLFNYVEGDKRKQFKKAMDRMKKRIQQAEMMEAKVDQNRTTPEQQLQTYNAILNECEAESSIIQSEIQRLQAQRTTLCEMIQYIEKSKK